MCAWVEEEEEPEAEPVVEEEEEEAAEAEADEAEPTKPKPPKPFAYVAEAEVLFTGMSYKSFADADAALKVRTAFATALHAKTEAVSFSRVVPGTSKDEEGRTAMVKVQMLAPTLAAAEHLQAKMNVLVGTSAVLNTALQEKYGSGASSMGVSLVAHPTVHALQTYETEIAAVAALASHREEVKLGETSEKRCVAELDASLKKMDKEEEMMQWCRSMFKHRGILETVGDRAVTNVCSMLENAFRETTKKERTSKRMCQVLHDAVSLYVSGDDKSAHGSVYPSTRPDEAEAIKAEEEEVIEGEEIQSVLKETFENTKELVAKNAPVLPHVLAATKRLRKTCEDNPDTEMCSMDPCKSHLLPGCNDHKIQECVCESQSYCCDGEWDWTCVQTVHLNGCSDKCRSAERVRYDEEPTIDLVLPAAVKSIVS